jgi:hypothetical protein
VKTDGQRKSVAAHRRPSKEQSTHCRPEKLERQTHAPILGANEVIAAKHQCGQHNGRPIANRCSQVAEANPAKNEFLREDHTRCKTERYPSG